MNLQAFRAIVILLAAFLLNACGDSCVRSCNSQGKDCERECGAGHCVDADDWGYPKLYVPATSSGNTLKGGILNQYAEGIDSGLVILDAENIPLVVGISKRDQWTSWFGGDINPGSDEGRPDPNGFDAGRTVPDIECNYVLENMPSSGYPPATSTASVAALDLSPKIIKIRSLTESQNSNSECLIPKPLIDVTDTGQSNYNACFYPDSYGDRMVPCYMRYGMGLYIGLAPNNGPATTPQDVVLTYHIPDAKAPDRRSYFAPTPAPPGEDAAAKKIREKADADRLRTGEKKDGLLINGLPKTELPGSQTGDRIYFKIVDRTYIDNSGGYHVKIKSGARGTDAGVLEKIANVFLDPMKVAMIRLYNGIVNNIEFVNAVRFILVMYIIFFGYIIMIGGGADIKKSAGIRLFKIVVILQVISEDSWNFFYNHLFGAFMGGIQAFAGILMNPFGDYDPNNPWYSMDQMLHKFWSGETWSKILSTFFSNSIGFLFIPAMFLAIAILTIAVFQALVTYLLAFGCIAILIVVAPIFLIFMLFEKTKHLTTEWFNQMVVFSFQQVILMAALGMFAAVVLSIMERTIGYNVCWNIWSRFGVAGFNIFDFKFWMPDISSDMVSIPLNAHMLDINGNQIQQTVTRYLDAPYLDPVYDKEQLVKIMSERNFISMSDILLLIGAVFLMKNFLKAVPSIASVLKSGASADSMNIFGGGASLLGSFASAAMPILGGIKNTATGIYSLTQNAEARYAAGKVGDGLSRAGGAVAGAAKRAGINVGGRVSNSALGKAFGSAVDSASSSVKASLDRNLNTKANRDSLARIERGLNNASSKINNRVAAAQAAINSAKKSVSDTKSALGKGMKELELGAKEAVGLAPTAGYLAYAKARDEAMLQKRQREEDFGRVKGLSADARTGLASLNKVLNREDIISRNQAQLWAAPVLNKALNALNEVHEASGRADLADYNRDIVLYQRDLSLQVLQALSHDNVRGVDGLAPTAETVEVLRASFKEAMQSGLISDNAKIEAISKNLNILEDRAVVAAPKTYDAATNTGSFAANDSSILGVAAVEVANANLAANGAGLAAGGVGAALPAGDGAVGGAFVPSSMPDLGGRQELSGVQEYAQTSTAFESSLLQSGANVEVIPVAEVPLEVAGGASSSVVEQVQVVNVVEEAKPAIMPVTEVYGNNVAANGEVPDVVQMLNAAAAVGKAGEEEVSVPLVDRDASATITGFAEREAALESATADNSFAVVPAVQSDLPTGDAAPIVDDVVVIEQQQSVPVAKHAGEPLVPETNVYERSEGDAAPDLVTALNLAAANGAIDAEILDPATQRDASTPISGLDDRQAALESAVDSPSFAIPVEEPTVVAPVIEDAVIEQQQSAPAVGEPLVPVTNVYERSEGDAAPDLVTALNLAAVNGAIDAEILDPATQRDASAPISGLDDRQAALESAVDSPSFAIPVEEPAVIIPVAEPAPVAEEVVIEQQKSAPSAGEPLMPVTNIFEGDDKEPVDYKAIADAVAAQQQGLDVDETLGGARDVATISGLDDNSAALQALAGEEAFVLQQSAEQERLVREEQDRLVAEEVRAKAEYDAKVQEILEELNAADARIEAEKRVVLQQEEEARAKAEYDAKVQEILEELNAEDARIEAEKRMILQQEMVGESYVDYVYDQTLLQQLQEEQGRLLAEIEEVSREQGVLGISLDAPVEVVASATMGSDTSLGGDVISLGEEAKTMGAGDVVSLGATYGVGEGPVEGEEVLTAMEEIVSHQKQVDALAVVEKLVKEIPVYMEEQKSYEKAKKELSDAMANNMATPEERQKAMNKVQAEKAKMAEIESNLGDLMQQKHKFDSMK